MKLVLLSFGKFAWGLGLALQVLLLMVLFARRRHWQFPALCSYLLLNSLQSVSLFVAYDLLGFHSRLAWRVAWISQGVVLAARAVAIGELCRHAVAGYRGIWALGWRVLATIAGIVLVLAISLGRHDLMILVLTFDLGIELAIAATLVGFFVFARYYDLSVEEPVLSLGLGFCLYSCVYVVNDAFLQRYMHSFTDAWNLISAVTFVVSLMLWLKAFWRPVRVPSSEIKLLDADIYHKLMPQVNERLLALSEQLNRVWKVESDHT